MLNLEFGRRRPSSLAPCTSSISSLSSPPSPIRLPSSSSLPRLPGGGPDRGAATAEAGPRHVRGLASSAECARFGGNCGLRFGRVSDKGRRCSSFYCILELKDGLQVAGAGSLRRLAEIKKKDRFALRCFSLRAAAAAHLFQTGSSPPASFRSLSPSTLQKSGCRLVSSTLESN